MIHGTGLILLWWLWLMWPWWLILVTCLACEHSAFWEHSSPYPSCLVSICKVMAVLHFSDLLIKTLGLKTIVNALFLSMKPLSEVLFIMVFLLVVIALIGLQSYMGVLLQKCVENGPSNMTDAEWYDWVQSEEHLMDGEEDTVLCGNSTGAGWVTFGSLLTFCRT